MTTTKGQLDAIALRREAAVLAAFEQVIQSIRDQAIISEIARLLNAGNVSAVIDLLQLDQATYEPLEHEILESFRTGGMAGAEQVGKIPMAEGALVARFNVRSPAAEAWAASLSSRLVVEIIEAQRETVREVIAQGLQAGKNPRTVALDLVGRVGADGKRVGGFIGLTGQQAQWVVNAREQLENLDDAYFNRELRDTRLDKQIKKYIKEGKKIPANIIDSAVTNMQANAERYRGAVIARTESINALREGQQQSIEQAFERSDVLEKEIQREWDSSGDAKTRPAHSRADGQKVAGQNSTFTVDGEKLRYPGDPRGSAKNTIQCRCRVKTRINFGAQLRRLEGFG